METERRYGKCSICREKRMLESCLGSRNGQLWAGWICHECYEKLKNKPKDGEIDG